MPSEYYSFKKGDWVFIMLNTNEIASYANIAGTPKENEWNRMQEQIKQIKGKYAYEWNGGILDSVGSNAFLKSLVCKEMREKGSFGLNFFSSPAISTKRFFGIERQ